MGCRSSHTCSKQGPAATGSHGPRQPTSSTDGKGRNGRANKGEDLPSSDNGAINRKNGEDSTDAIVNLGFGRREGDTSDPALTAEQCRIIKETWPRISGNTNAVGRKV